MPFFYVDWYYIVLVLPAVILSLWASAHVKSTFRRYSQVRNARGMTGAEAAMAVLRAHGVTDVRVMDSKRVGNKMGMLRTMFLDIEYPGETIKKSRGSKITAVGDHEITYAFTNKAKKTVEKTRHFDSLVIATGMHSRPTQDLTDACSELGIPCDVIGSAKKADMGIEATADAYAAAMNV